MIDKSVNYNDKDFSKHLKGLGLSEKEIKYILGETKRKKFENGGDGSSGDGSSGDGSSGDGSSGDSGQGDSGPGGSDDGSGHGGPGQGDSGPGGSDDGTGHGGPGPGDTGSVGPSDEGFGIGPNAEAEAEASNAANQGISAAVAAVNSFAKQAIQNAINNPISTVVGAIKGTPAGLAVNALSQAYSNFSRGVTAPNDYSQSTTSVQSGPSQSPSSGGGINTIQAYAPTYNPDTGNPTMDAYIRRLRVNLGLPV